MSIAANFDFEALTKGNTFEEVQMTVQEEVNNVVAPLDLTGYTVCMQLRKSYKGRIAFSFTTEILDPLNGIVKIHPVDKMDIEPFDYHYDITISNANGTDNFTYVEGKFEILKNISEC